MIKAILRVLRALILVLAALLVIFDLILEVAVAPKKVGEFFVEQMQARLDRQVRIGAVRVGLWKGLRMEQVSISEARDFSAGTFLQVEHLRLAPRLLPLLAGRIAFGEIELDHPKIKIVRDRERRLNFSDLTDSPPIVVSIDDAGIKGPGGAVWTSVVRTASLQIRKIRVRDGEINYIDRATGLNLFLSEVTARADHLLPRGNARFQVDFKVASAHFGKTMTAQVTAAANARLDNYYPASISGRITLTHIRHPNFKTERIHLEWDLNHLTPDLLSAEGVVKLQGASGELINLEELRKGQARWAATLLYPLEILTRFRGMSLPDLPEIAYSELRGDYSLKAGSLNIAPFFIEGPTLSLHSEGVISLRRKEVGLKANLVMGKTSVGVLAQGPIDNPAVVPGLSFSGTGKSYQTIRQKLNIGQ